MGTGGWYDWVFRLAERVRSYFKSRSHEEREILISPVRHVK